MYPSGVASVFFFSLFLQGLPRVTCGEFRLFYLFLTHPQNRLQFDFKMAGSSKFQTLFEQGNQAKRRFVSSFRLQITFSFYSFEIANDLFKRIFKSFFPCLG